MGCYVRGPVRYHPEDRKAGVRFKRFKLREDGQIKIGIPKIGGGRGNSHWRSPSSEIDITSGKYTFTTARS